MMTSLWLVLLVSSLCQADWYVYDTVGTAEYDNEDDDYFYLYNREKSSTAKTSPHTTAKSVKTSVTTTQAQNERLDLDPADMEDEETADGSGETSVAVQPMLTARRNLALHQPATQSSSYLADGAGLAGQAVDGSLQPQWQNSPQRRFLCTHTNIEDQPWWAVDLGAVTNVGHIKVTIRSDCCNRLSDFTVGLTNVSPWTTAPPVVDQGPPCAFYQGHPPLGSTTTIHCDPRSSPGRYLFIRLAGVGVLVLCEVQVFARDVTTASSVQVTQVTTASSVQITDVSTASSVQVTQVYQHNSSDGVLHIQKFRRLLAESVRQLLAADPTCIQQLRIDATDEAGRIRVTFDIKTPNSKFVSKLESVLTTLGEKGEVISITHEGVTYTPVPETLAVKKCGGEGVECESGGESKWTRERLIVVSIAVMGGMLLLCAVCICLVAYKKLCNPSEKMKLFYSELYQKA